MEVTFETARVIFNLLYKGALEQYPNIKWSFSHAGDFALSNCNVGVATAASLDNTTLPA